MKNILNHSTLFKDVTVLVSGTALAQLIPILLQPVLRRFFSPEDFGAYAVYLSVVGILVVLASMRYEYAVVLPGKDKQAANLVVLAVLINVLFSSFLLLIILIFIEPIMDLVKLPHEYSLFLYLVPAGVFLFSFYQSLNYWLIRKKRFLPVSLNKFVRRGAEGSGQIGFMMLGKPSGLVLGDIMGHTANIISGTIQAVRSGFTFAYIRLIKIRYVAKKYNEYPRFNVLPGFMSACSYLLPAIFINRFYSTEFTGYFDLSKLMLSIPLALVATSISNVLLQRISVSVREKKSVVNDLFSILRFVLIIALLEIIVIRIWGVELFSIIFGSEWRFSGEISRLLVWSFSFNFLVASFTSIFISMKRIKLMSIWQLVYFLAIFSLVFFRNTDFITFLKIYVIIEICCYASIAILMLIIVLRYESRLKRFIL